MKKIIFIAILSVISIASQAQIAYQVALLNKATGEPRANENVNVSITLSGHDGTKIYEDTQSKTSNDFGILSLTVGKSDTFDNVDWEKALPLSIEVKVNGTTIAKSDVLSVPVAEYAKRTGVLTYEMLEGKVASYRDNTFTFKSDKTFSLSMSGRHIYPGQYYIDGNMIIMTYQRDEYTFCRLAFYNPKTEKITVLMQYQE